MDQLKVNMLAREYSDTMQKRLKRAKTKEDKLKKEKFKKPIIISHHMLMGLKKGQEKVNAFSSRFVSIECPISPLSLDSFAEVESLRFKF